VADPPAPHVTAAVRQVRRGSRTILFGDHRTRPAIHAAADDAPAALPLARGGTEFHLRVAGVQDIRRRKRLKAFWNWLKELFWLRPEETATVVAQGSCRTDLDTLAT